MTETQKQQPENLKKLYRSNENKMTTGLLGGVAEYFSIDATIVRLGVAFIAVVTGLIPGFIFYLIASWIVPKKDTIKKVI